ncbi:MAG: DUF222 domain-containing protein, partial [Microbacterium sp.]
MDDTPFLDDMDASVASGDAAPAVSPVPAVSARGVVRGLLEDLACLDGEVNRVAARRAERVVEVVAFARSHPEVYTRDADVHMAERAAIFDIALRLRITEDQVRYLYGSTSWAMGWLPALWQQARDGFATIRQVDQVRECLHPVQIPVDASPDAVDELAAVTATVDAAAAEWVLDCAPETFRRKVKRLVDSACGDTASRRHARALTDRCVRTSPAGDGMSWLTALIPTLEASKIMGRLTATAKHVQNTERRGRTRDQLRADLLCDWLTGRNTSTAVKTKVFVTIPVQLLTRTHTAAGASAGAGAGAGADAGACAG